MNQPPSGERWSHEIKHDGYRIIARREDQTVRLWSRAGNDWAHHFTAVRDALLRLPLNSVILDGEACAHCPEGLPDFYSLLSGDGGARACYFAFDLLSLDGQDLRLLPLYERKERLTKLLADQSPTLAAVEYLTGDGATIFEHACRLSVEGIVSKRLDSRYRSGRSDAWQKTLNPEYARRHASGREAVLA